MFRIDKDDNSIKPLQARSFSELGFKEHQHLQELIAKYPSCLGGRIIAAEITTSLAPVIAMIFGNAGLRLGASLEGVKYTRITP